MFHDYASIQIEIPVYCEIHKHTKIKIEDFSEFMRDTLPITCRIFLTLFKNCNLKKKSRKLKFSLCFEWVLQFYLMKSTFYSDNLHAVTHAFTFQNGWPHQYNYCARWSLVLTNQKARGVHNSKTMLYIILVLFHFFNVIHLKFKIFIFIFCFQSTELYWCENLRFYISSYIIQK